MTTKAEASAAAAALARRRRSRRLTCTACNAPFKAVDLKAMYCSNACKVAMYRARKAAAKELIERYGE